MEVVKMTTAGNVPSTHGSSKATLYVVIAALVLGATIVGIFIGTQATPSSSSNTPIINSTAGENSSFEEPAVTSEALKNVLARDLTDEDRSTIKDHEYKIMDLFFANWEEEFLALVKQDGFTDNASDSYNGRYQLLLAEQFVEPEVAKYLLSLDRPGFALWVMNAQANGRCMLKDVYPFSLPEMASGSEEAKEHLPHGGYERAFVEPSEYYELVLRPQIEQVSSHGFGFEAYAFVAYTYEETSINRSTWEEIPVYGYSEAYKLYGKKDGSWYMIPHFNDATDINNWY